MAEKFVFLVERRRGGAVARLWDPEPEKTRHVQVISGREARAFMRKVRKERDNIMRKRRKERKKK